MENFHNHFIKEFKLNKFDFYSKSTNIKIYEFLSEKIKRNFLIFVKNLNKNTSKLVYSTNFKNFKSIKLLIDNDHCKFIFNNINLEEKYKTFCEFCKKSFSKIKEHKCKRKTCPNCLCYTKLLIDEVDTIICKNEINTSINYSCEFCNKIIKNIDCKKRHLALSKNNCTKTLYCNLCKKNYLKKFTHKCDYYFCKKCLKIHELKMFCSTSIQNTKKSIKETIFFLDIKYFKSNIHFISICKFNKTDLIKIYYFYKEENYYKKIIINKVSLKIVQMEKKDLNINLNIINIIHFLDIMNLKPKFLLEQKHLEYFINNLDLIDINVLSKDSLIYCVKTKHFSFVSINQYVTYDPLFLLKMSNIKINPLYIIDIETNTLLNDKLHLNINDFTNHYIHSDYNMYDYLNSFKNEIENINKLSLFDFMDKSTLYKTIIYGKSIESLNSIIKELSYEMNKHCITNNLIFNCVTEKNSSSSASFNLFLNAIQHQPLPILNSKTPGEIYNTSKYEICFCETLTELHLKQNPLHLIKSYINDNGEQFKKSKFSLDW